MMIKPSIDQLTNGGEINRYELVIATSKVARVITDEYCAQRERAETMIRNGETDKNLATLIKGNIRDKKAVENAVQALADGEFEIVLDPVKEEDENAEEAAEEAKEETLE
ncbi:MAG: hypothetical protein IJX27_00630 [Clostridia bacterium]|nr:hypothetical protein [Clostridia bacterium]